MSLIMAALLYFPLHSVERTASAGLAKEPGPTLSAGEVTSEPATAFKRALFCMII